MNRLDDFLRFHETVLSVRGQRQQLLASNIANADTPNYKARDLDFASAMSRALQGAGAAGAGPSASGTVLEKTQAAHLDPRTTEVDAQGNRLLYRGNGQGNIDGNTVDMDVERNQFTDNALRYEASLTMLNMQIRSMLAAIQGQ